jgi:hypothetical protein
VNASACFAQTYAEARRKFLAAADAAGLDVQSHRHPLRGMDGEELAMDVARYGPRDAAALLLITSGCHGVEGFCGSGVQNALLADGDFRAQAAQAGVAVLYVHALNPWGFSCWRRTTNENVDLNRNWLDFHAPLPHNADYDAIAHRLLPLQWPPTLLNEAALLAYAARHGKRALQTAISAGQTAHPQGLFYAGSAPTWSQLTLRQVLQEHGTRCARLAWMDLHTGLGPAGHGERIFSGRHDDAAALARARTWWGAGVTSIAEGHSSSAPLSGQMFVAAYQECPQAQYTGIALEFGTVPLLETINALREDQWCEIRPELPAERRLAARRRMRRAFYTDTDGWKARVVEQGVQAARLAVAGLATATSSMS